MCRPSSFLRLVFVIVVLTTVMGLLIAYDAVRYWPGRVDHGAIRQVDVKHYAVFACSTPDEQSHRGYDYAFYLPLTVLAWRRIGFESIVLIIGTENVHCIYRTNTTSW